MKPKRELRRPALGPIAELAGSEAAGARQRVVDAYERFNQETPCSVDLPSNFPSISLGSATINLDTGEVIADASAPSAGDPASMPGARSEADGRVARTEKCEWCGRTVPEGSLTPIYDSAPTGERDWVCASCRDGESGQPPLNAKLCSGTGQSAAAEPEK